jgi:hypothetical protein
MLKAVAMPPKLFWAPMSPAALNLVVHIACMFVGLAAFDSNPLWFMGSIVFFHLFLVAYGAREPHLSKMMESLGKMRVSKNVYHTGGNKYAP